MRVLLNTIGTAGDVHPYIALALALKARGHEAVILANPFFAARINGAGVGFWPVGTEAEYVAFVKASDLAAGRRSVGHVLSNLIVPSFSPCLDAVDSAWRAFRPDAAVVHHISFGAAAACEKIGLPYALGVLAPLFWLSRSEPILFPVLPLREPPAFVDRALRSWLRPVGRWMVDRRINRLRRGAGFVPLRDVSVRSARGGDGVLAHERVTDPDKAVPALGLWSEHFRAPMPDDPARGAICGFCPWDRPVVTTRRAAELKELAEWMERGPAPVLVTLGSSVAHHGGEVYRRVAEACGKLDRRVVLLTGSGEGLTGDERVRSIDYAPISMLLPRCQAAVHHAGIGTTAGVLRAGRPAVMIPHANDGYDNADRVRRLGIGLSISPRKASTAVLCALLDRVMNDRDMASRAKALGEKLQAENGAAKAAVKIEGLVR
jgi:UDP:flavonoid glycosyltransferase YjiC (YdhE family)